MDDFLGQIDLTSLWETKHGHKTFSPKLGDGKSSVECPDGKCPNTPPGKVCVVTEQATGRFVDKFFELPKIEKGERVVAHFTATGHGWANTDSQCGEFCKMKYKVAIDGDRPADFSLWRDDCDANPTGNEQYGTWYNPRNGWCPGAVSDGVYFDITDSLKKDSTKHRLTVDLSVMNRYSGEYEPYTNMKGWMVNDRAILPVDLKVFIYPKEAVQTARDVRGKACSKVHAALQAGPLEPQGGSSKQGSRLVPQPVKVKKSSNPHRASEEEKGKKSLRVDQLDAPSCSIDFEKTAPWHMFHDTAPQGQEKDDITWVSVFHEALVQGPTQVQTIRVDGKTLPESWGQVGLRLRLLRPKGLSETGSTLDFDHWDRIASIGMVVDLPLPPPVPQPKPTPKPKEPKEPQPRQPYTLWWCLSVFFMAVAIFTMLHVTIATSRQKWDASRELREALMPVKGPAKPQRQAEHDTTYGTVPKFRG
jgi:hypothetical protein